MNWYSFWMGVAACFALWVLSFMPGCTNCGRPDCLIHGFLNEAECEAEPEPVEVSRDKPKPKYLFQPGELVEHFEIGECVVNGNVNTSAAIPIYQINWYEEETNKRHHNFQVWETELKKIDLSDYPKPEPKHNLERDLELQMMEERIEKEVRQRLQEQDEAKAQEVIQEKEAEGKPKKRKRKP